METIDCRDSAYAHSIHKDVDHTYLNLETPASRTATSSPPTCVEPTNPTPEQEPVSGQQSQFFLSSVYHLVEPTTPHLTTTFQIQAFLAFNALRNNIPHPSDQLTLQIIIEVLLRKLEATHCVIIASDDTTTLFLEWLSEAYIPILQTRVKTRDQERKLLDLVLWSCLVVSRETRGDLFSPMVVCLRRCDVLRDWVVDEWVDGIWEILMQGRGVPGVADLLFKYQVFVGTTGLLGCDMEDAEDEDDLEDLRTGMVDCLGTEMPRK
ncbi:hypothetical protein BCR33DRAFT_730658 [Rhizoclosmatium globosum]|uniref:Uncharacterized protein n=1 Tax=Rhizoclosmatium globosum TaxID=329046 RepID=A0A1Y2ABR7_9FUNG|nr:hypothetical protein BCR33DRAFT_730658 [Rhizoclosmatium globosum]|eukprot:ORY20003.1 hypothetical protein BCR33DRAFT_730658 [Rhizoclosmatium globosum]